jgi:hypothetical protein
MVSGTLPQAGEPFLGEGCSILRIQLDGTVGSTRKNDYTGDDCVGVVPRVALRMK